MTKHILVTGADGFIGSHLTEMLLEQGHKVRALSQYNSFNNWGWLEGNTHPNLEVVPGDIRDPHFCRTLVKDIDTVYFDFCQQLSQKSNSSIKNIADLTAYNSRFSSLTKEIEQLKKKILACPQFNKKVELNLSLKKLEEELRILKA